MSDVFSVVLFTAVLVLPGAALVLGAGVRGWTAMAASPTVSYGLIAISAQLFGSLELRFGLLPLVVATAAATCLAVALRKLSEHLGGATNRPASEVSGCSATHSRANSRWLLGVILLGTVLGAATVLTATNSLEAIPQGRDAIWHANLVRFILESGSASPTAVAEVCGFHQCYYYPNVYHAGVALVGMVTHSSIPSLAGAHLMLVPGVTGLGLAGMVRRFTQRTALAAAVPVVAAMSYVFPYHLMAWGPLWPFLTGIALIPGFILLVTEALDRGPRAGAILMIAGIAAAGLLGVHTGAAVTAGVFIFCLLLARWRTEWPSAVLRADLLVVAGIASAAVIAAPIHLSALLGLGRVVSEANVDFPVIGTPAIALADLLLVESPLTHSVYWLFGLMVIGVLGWRRLRSLGWWFAASAVFLALYVAAASYNSALTETLTLPWWNDYQRLAGIVSLTLIILAAGGLVTVTDAVVTAARHWIPALDRTPRRRLIPAAGLSVALALGLVTNGFYLPVNGTSLNAVYRDAPLISADEQEAMRALAEMVGPGERVMNDPNDGSPWMWALVDVRPVFAYTVRDITDPSLTADGTLLLRSFRCLDSDPEVRAAIARNHITHVFLGQGFIASYLNRVEGLENIQDSDSLTLVYNQNDVEIYEINLSPLEAPTKDCSGQTP